MKILDVPVQENVDVIKNLASIDKDRRSLKTSTASRSEHKRDQAGSRWDDGGLLPAKCRRDGERPVVFVVQMNGSNAYVLTHAENDPISHRGII